MKCVLELELSNAFCSFNSSHLGSDLAQHVSLEITQESRLMIYLEEEEQR